MNILKLKYYKDFERLLRFCFDFHLVLTNLFYYSMLLFEIISINSNNDDCN